MKRFFIFILVVALFSSSCSAYFWNDAPEKKESVVLDFFKKSIDAISDVSSHIQIPEGLSPFYSQTFEKTTQEPNFNTSGIFDQVGPAVSSFMQFTSTHLYSLKQTLENSLQHRADSKDTTSPRYNPNTILNKGGRTARRSQNAALKKQTTLISLKSQLSPLFNLAKSGALGGVTSAVDNRDKLLQGDYKEYATTVAVDGTATAAISAIPYAGLGLSAARVVMECSAGENGECQQAATDTVVTFGKTSVLLYGSALCGPYFLICYGASYLATDVAINTFMENPTTQEPELKQPAATDSE